jgi:phospholipid/cholesterol/gamma-HCH transport system substrate-binding protein
MQFRIGMFVIVAGLVLTMMIVWFEAPALVRERKYLTIYFREAPGINQGIPVRKSGVRIGEVFSFEFTGPQEPVEGVLVTISLDPRYHVRAGSIPKLSRALIGDVSIDMLPSDGEKPIETFKSVAESLRPGNRIDGIVATDPFVLLNGATKIFEEAEKTLVAIEAAATGLTEITKKAGDLDVLLKNLSNAGESVDKLASDVDRVLRENEAEIKPALAGIRGVATKLDSMLSDANREKIEKSLDDLSGAFARLDRLMADIEPFARDLSAKPGEAPATNVGQTLARINRMTYDLNLLTSQLSDAQGKFNRNGTLQMLVSDPQLYTEVRNLARTADTTVSEARVVINYLRQFAEKISRNPAVLGEGILPR